MKLTQYQRDAIEVIRARLDPKHPGFMGSPEIRKALTSNGIMCPLAIYMQDTLMLLDVLEGGGYHGQRAYVAHDAVGVRARARRAWSEHLRDIGNGREDRQS